MCVNVSFTSWKKRKTHFDHTQINLFHFNVPYIFISVPFTAPYMVSVLFYPIVFLFYLFIFETLFKLRVRQFTCTRFEV